MSIIKVIVNALPESASRCFAAESHWNALEEFEVVECRFKQVWAYIDFDNFITQRCPGCPLELEKQAKGAPPRYQPGATVYLNENTKWEDGDYVLNPEMNIKMNINYEPSLTDELLKDRQSSDVMLERICELAIEKDNYRKWSENLESRLNNYENLNDDLVDENEKLETRIAELEKLIDQLVEAGRALTSVAEWRYANLTELLAWDTLVENIYKERGK